MGQIALQGRKYGVGLLLVSQRTALVSKTLLSQCNTCISFAMYDKTGLDYMRSIYGEEHVKAIPNFPFRHAVGFGKGVLSDRPIVFEVPYDENKKTASESLDYSSLAPDSQPKVAEADSWDDDDDIPF